MQAIEVGKRMSASESDVHTHTGSSLVSILKSVWFMVWSKFI